VTSVLSSMCDHSTYLLQVGPLRSTVVSYPAGTAAPRVLICALWQTLPNQSTGPFGPYCIIRPSQIVGLEVPSPQVQSSGTCQLRVAVERRFRCFPSQFPRFDRLGRVLRTKMERVLRNVHTTY